MQRRNRIGATRKLQTEHGHAEHLLAFAILAAKVHQAIVGDSQQIAQWPQVLLNQLRIEAVVARGNRGVGGEAHLLRDAIGGLVKVKSLVLHAIVDRFKQCESAVAFIQVEHTRRDAHGLEGAEASDAQQNLLADARAAVAAIQPRGEQAVFRAVAVHIRVKQEQVAAANLHAPDLGEDRAAARVDADGNGLSIGANRRLHRHLGYIGLDVFLLLPAAEVEPLPEVALAVEKSNANQRNIQVGRALDVVARQNAQSTGVDRDGLMQSELRGEVDRKSTRLNSSH